MQPAGRADRQTHAMNREASRDVRLRDDSGAVPRHGDARQPAGERKIDSDDRGRAGETREFHPRMRRLIIALRRASFHTVSI